ncbi:MAG: hypothetical protein J6U60_01000, partial [Clostridia bacterium]|nr:hypothetical protein [Clostridia bacterium]
FGTDQELSDLITDIVAVSEGTITVTLTGVVNALITGTGYSVNEKDWKRIYEARNIMYNNAVEHSLMIPTYAVAKEGAVEFTKFFFSDEALEIYFKETHFSYPVYFSDENKKIEQTGWSAFEKQLYSYYLTGIPVSNRTFSRSVIFDDGGIDDCANIQIINQLSAKGTARKTAEALWKEIEAAVDKDWSTWLKNAGLS